MNDPRTDSARVVCKKCDGDGSVSDGDGGMTRCRECDMTGMVSETPKGKP